MRIVNQMPDHDITCDVTTNPEFILLAAEDEEATCDEVESLWLAGQAVTKPKTSQYD